MTIDNSFLDQLLQQAQINDRKRQIHLLHMSYDAPSQRMLNAMIPGTKIPIHRHNTKDETYTILRGCIKVNFFTGKKELTKQYVLSLKTGNLMLVIPQGQWHSVDVIEPSVIFEVCDGPYTPLAKEDVLE